MELRFVPGPHTHRSYTPPIGADGETIVFPIFKAPDDAAVRIRSIRLIPQAAVTGHATDRKDLELVNVGLLGVGTEGIGTDLEMVAGVDFVALKPYDLFAPASSDDYHELDAGEVVTLEVEDNETSPAFPSCLVEVEFEYAGVGA